MRKYLYCLFIILITSTLFAQTESKETIKNSKDYYWGESSSENDKEAEDAALSRLTKQISVTISSTFERTMQETNENLQETVQDILKTYSSATLKNVQSIRNSSGGMVNVFLYIAKSEVNEIFAERKKLINNIYSNAVDFEQDQNYAGALKSYYFALLLMNSIPEQNIMFNDKSLTTEIPYRINTIITNTKFYLVKDTKISDNERELEFLVEVFDKKANQLDFSFWDGLNQVNVQVMDGDAIFNLIGTSSQFDKLDVNIKYSYYECRNEISVVNELWNVVNRPSFKNTKQVPLKVTEKKEQITEIKKEIISSKDENKVNNSKTTFVEKENKPVLFKGTRELLLINKDSCKVLNKISDQTEKLISIFERGSSKSVNSMFPNDDFIRNKITDMMKYNKINITAGSITADVNKTFTGWELRKIKIVNKYSSLNKQSPEYMVLDFDDNGNLYDVNFGIMDNLYDKFVEQGTYGNDWGNRQVIIKFVEKYRTAFLSRNIKMLDSLFADEAVIIVGRVLKKTKMKDIYKYTKLNEDQPDIRYTQYTKDEYLKNQANVFKNQKDIFVGYNSFKIMKKNKQDNVYGLSMRQFYQATSYSDEGYLFLLVDFNNEQPQIYVRSWQPQEWNETALIKLSNFNLNKLEK